MLLNLLFDTGIHFKINAVMLYNVLTTFLTLCFFANDLLLAVYFIFILDYGNEV